MVWSTILLKDSHLFEIAELEKFLKQKLITNSAILNKKKSFSGMVDKWHGPPKDCIISPTNWLNQKKKKVRNTINVTIFSHTFILAMVGLDMIFYSFILE